mmetsp:Transcript_5245/g.7348  ORF Transcript_5245/g.7348 Transcript_5245/m.7348 type:complete len:110 (-) Transcript_5245:618-947(-)
MKASAMRVTWGEQVLGTGKTLENNDIELVKKQGLRPEVGQKRKDVWQIFGVMWATLLVCFAFSVIFSVIFMCVEKSLGVSPTQMSAIVDKVPTHDRNMQFMSRILHRHN